LEIREPSTVYSIPIQTACTSCNPRRDPTRNSTLREVRSLFWEPYQYEQYHQGEDGLGDFCEQINTDGVEGELALLVFREVHQHWLQPCMAVEAVMRS
jgi:hypothetical protein